MRIAVDARPFEERPTGAGRVLEGLLGAWRRLFPEDSFVLLSPRRACLRPPLDGDAAVTRGSASGLPGTLWLQVRAAAEARRAGAELFLGSLAVVPAAG